MRSLPLGVFLGLALATGCAPAAVDSREGRAAYDGAPPVIGHEALGASCTSCHAEGGLRVPGLGVAPASPHAQTAGMAAARCEQCHVYRTTEAAWVESRFTGLRPARGEGHRLYPGAPPVLPHPVFMREDCLACHAGEASQAVPTTHPERERCRQCHVASRTTRAFEESP